MGSLRLFGSLLLLVVALCHASEAVFSVNDDLFTFPQVRDLGNKVSPI